MSPLNNQKLKTENVANCGNLWQNVNRTMITDVDHESKYGRKRTTIPNTSKLMLHEVTSQQIRDAIANMDRSMTYVEKVKVSELEDSYKAAETQEAAADEVVPVDDDDETAPSAGAGGGGAKRRRRAAGDQTVSAEDDEEIKKLQAEGFGDLDDLTKEKIPTWDAAKENTARITFDSKRELVEQTLELTKTIFSKTTMSGELKDAILPYRMTSDEDVVLLPFTFDEVFPFSMQSNVTRNLTGVDKENPYLPPGTDFTIRIERADNTSVNLERFNMDNYKEFFKGNTDFDLPDMDDVVIVIRNVFLGFEVLTLPTPSAFPVPGDGVLRYRPDIIHSQQLTLEPNSKTLKKRLMVPPATAAVVAVFTTGEFMSPTYPSKRHATTNLLVPEGLEFMQMTHYTTRCPVKHRVLKDLGTPKAYSTKENQEYHKELVRLNMNDLPMYEWLPHEEGNIPLGFAYMANTIKDQEKEYSDMIVDLTFQVPGQGSNWKLIVFFVTQGLITCNTKTGIWKLD